MYSNDTQYEKDIIRDIKYQSVERRRNKSIDYLCVIKVKMSSASNRL